MHRYGNRSGHAGVVAYDSGPDWIVLRFADGATYRYDRQHPGLLQVMEMQRLAAAGRGLTQGVSPIPECAALDLAGAWLVLCGAAPDWPSGQAAQRRPRACQTQP